MHGAMPKAASSRAALSQSRMPRCREHSWHHPYDTRKHRIIPAKLEHIIASTKESHQETPTLRQPPRGPPFFQKAFTPEETFTRDQWEMVGASIGDWITNVLREVSGDDVTSIIGTVVTNLLNAAVPAVLRKNCSWWSGRH